MSNGRNWCEIYVDGKVTAKELADLVLSCVDGAVTFTDKRRFWDMKTNWGDLSVGENDGYNTPRRKRSREDEFMYYRYLIDAEPISREFDAPYEASMVALVESLRRSGLRVAPVADFME